jgi:hypothetical protein
MQPRSTAQPDDEWTRERGPRPSIPGTNRSNRLLLRRRALTYWRSVSAKKEQAQHRGKADQRYACPDVRG